MSTVKEYATGKVIVAPNPATNGTSITVDNPAQFPDPATFGEYEVVLWPQAIEPTPNNHCEIVKVTAKTSVGDNAELTIVRAQNETFGLDVKQGWSVYNPALQGGSGGTTNYNDLSNKPNVNNVELSGDKTDKDLKLAGMADIAATFANTNAYAAGDYFWYSDVLYRATKAIAVGGSVITSGANQNVQAVTVGPELTNLANKDNQQQEEINYSINTGAKNQLPNTGESKTHNGITFTKNADGTITANGTATSEAFYTVANNLKLSGRLKLTGCPTGGAADKYILAVKNNTSGAWLSPYEVGTGVVYDFDETAEYEVRFIIRSGQTLDNAIIKPMIRDNVITDDTYVPYALNNADLTNKAETQQSQIDYNTNNGVKNLLPSSGESTLTTNGVTFTKNEDGSITVNGTATSQAYYNIQETAYKKGSYVLNGCPSGGSKNTYRLSFYKRSGSTSWQEQDDLGNGATFEVAADGDIFLTYIHIYSGATVSNLTFKPMIRDAAITDDTYVPYALSNADLTSRIYQVDYNTNNGVKNILDTSRAKEEHSVIDYVNVDGSLTWKSVGVSTTYIAKAQLKKGVVYSISSDIDLAYGRVAISSSPDAISSQAGANAPDITMLSGATHWIYALRATGQIKESTFRANSDQTVYFWTGGDGTFTAPQTTKLMLRELNVGDSSYVPFALDNASLTSNVNVLNQNKNILVNNATTQTLNGVTFTVNEDKSITMNGTATANTFFNLGSSGVVTKLKAGKSYILSSGTTIPTGMLLNLREGANTAGIVNVVAGQSENSVTITSDKEGFAYFQVTANTTLNNVTFYPMLREAGIADSTYTEPVDTGWVQLVNGLFYCKKNGIVTVQIDFAVNSIPEITVGQWVTFNTNSRIPTNASPKRTIAFTGVARKANNDAYDTNFRLQINSGGHVQIQTFIEISNTTHNSLAALATYPV